MAEDFPHLVLQRETPVTDKRPAQPPRFNTPADVRGRALCIQINASENGPPLIVSVRRTLGHPE
jgi:hypothetical protein